MTNVPQGIYRTEPVGTHGPRAYVQDGNIASFVEEDSYRRKGYQPPFEQLPTEADYKKAKHAKGT
jgi:hypothetical protein